MLAHASMLRDIALNDSTQSKGSIETFCGLYAVDYGTLDFYVFFVCILGLCLCFQLRVCLASCLIQFIKCFRCSVLLLSSVFVFSLFVY